MHCIHLCLCVAVVSVIMGLCLGQICLSGVTMTLRPPRLCRFPFIFWIQTVTATLHIASSRSCLWACVASAWSKHGVAAFVSYVFPVCFALCCPVLTHYDTVQLNKGMPALQEMWPQAHQHPCRSSQPICSSLSQACMSASPTSPLPTPPLPTWSCGAGWSPATLPLPLPLLLAAATLKVRQLCCSCCVCLSCC